MAKKAMQWENLALVVLGLLVLLVAPEMPLFGLGLAHPQQHWVLGVLLVLLGLWQWFGKK